jgi:hypothetical protein
MDTVKEAAGKAAAGLDEGLEAASSATRSTVAMATSSAQHAMSQAHQLLDQSKVRRRLGSGSGHASDGSRPAAPGSSGAMRACGSTYPDTRSLDSRGAARLRGTGGRPDLGGQTRARGPHPLPLRRPSSTRASSSTSRRRPPCSTRYAVSRPARAGAAWRRHVQRLCAPLHLGPDQQLLAAAARRRASPPPPPPPIPAGIEFGVSNPLISYPVAGAAVLLAIPCESAAAAAVAAPALLPRGCRASSHLGRRRAPHTPAARRRCWAWIPGRRAAEPARRPPARPSA